MAGREWLPEVRRAPSRQVLGKIAAGDIAADLRARLAAQRSVRMIFAAAPSQAETLAALAVAPGIAWERVTAFHMDEYLDLPPAAPQRFGRWLSTALFDRLPFAAVHLIDTEAPPPVAAQAYAALLAAAPIDIVCLGIGVNGHLAFNDPPVADFADPLAVKCVTLDAVCRRQQVDDGCFASLDLVPRQALTLTIPRLLAAKRLFCMVPGAAKRTAVRRCLTDPIGPACPATALRLHPRCTLYLDAESAADAP
jgi:glucosamine-6-phosphate deaminase